MGPLAGPAAWFKLNVLNGIRTVGLTRETAGMALSTVLLTIGAILLIPKVVRRFGWALRDLPWCSSASPRISSKDFYGLGRYMLAAFPVVAIVGEWLVDRPVWLRAGVWSVSGALLAFVGYSYARGLLCRLIPLVIPRCPPMSPRSGWKRSTPAARRWRPMSSASSAARRGSVPWPARPRPTS